MFTDSLGSFAIIGVSMVGSNESRFTPPATRRLAAATIDLDCWETRIDRARPRNRDRKMEIKYIDAAMSVADHRSDCCCSHCQTDDLILQDESISHQTRSIARIASEPIRARIERADRDRYDRNREYELTRKMTGREYSIYLSQPKSDRITHIDPNG